MTANLKVNIAGVEFKNPIIPASGTFGFGKEYSKFYDLSILGGLCSKGLTLLERQGNEYPRIAETPMGMLNSVGLQNPGVKKFLTDDLKWLRSQGTRIIANIAGNTIEDYQQMCEAVSVDGVDMVEVNISCPNVKAGGMAFGILPKSVEEVTRAVRGYCNKPLIIKLSPNVASIADNALAAEGGGADCVSLINTLSGMAVDFKTKRPILANVQGGLSGPCVKPIALRMVYQVAKAVKIPIIGLGGIIDYKDVIEFMLCGATAVEIGTANIIDPMASYNIVRDLTKYVEDNSIDINSLIGGLKE